MNERFFSDQLAISPDKQPEDVNAPKNFGGMREKVSLYDWASSPLGPREQWCPELKVIVEQVLDSGFPKAVVWGDALTTIYNDAFLPILGDKPEALGRSFADIWSEVWDDVQPLYEKAKAGESTFLENYPLSILRGERPEMAYFTFCYSPLRLGDGSIGGMLDTVIETTSSVRASADLAVINEELAHRLKNTLAMVQAIASQTLRDVTEQESVNSFRQRLQSLAHAHDVLLRQSWTGVSLNQVIEDSLRPHDHAAQIELTGPPVEIGSRTTMSLSLMLHELATNALKYGALSEMGGNICIDWSISQDMFHLSWKESGGPRISEPSRKGFGSRLIARGIGNRCEVTKAYRPEGFELELETPLADLSF